MICPQGVDKKLTQPASHSPHAVVVQMHPDSCVCMPLQAICLQVLTLMCRVRSMQPTARSLSTAPNSKCPLGSTPHAMPGASRPHFCNLVECLFSNVLTQDSCARQQDQGKSACSVAGSYVVRSHSVHAPRTRGTPVESVCGAAPDSLAILLTQSMAPCCQC